MQASGDADATIAMSGIEAAKECDGNVAVVSRDTDILVLLLGRAKSEDIYLVQPQPGKEDKTYSIQRIKQRIGPDICDILLVLHALTGCDTNSAPFRKGEGKGTDSRS